MSLSRIIDALEHSPSRGAQAQALARLGFLEWLFAAPGPVTAAMVREALATGAAQGAQSDAARAFVGYLHAACVSTVAPARRGRARLVN